MDGCAAGTHFKNSHGPLRSVGFMDEAGEALLADAALTDDQDRGIESGNLRSAVKRFLHRGTGHTQTEFSRGTMPV